MSLPPSGQHSHLIRDYERKTHAAGSDIRWHHLAGFSNDPTAEYSPSANWEINALATERLAKLCLESGVKRLVFGSSCSVYNGSDGEKDLDETVALEARGAYATAKQYAEVALLEAAERGLEPVVLRQGTAFGFSTRMRFDLVVNTFVKEALIRNRLVVHGDGRAWRPLVGVQDLAKAHVACLEAPSSLVAGEIFNVVHRSYQIRDLAEEVAQTLGQLGRPVEIVRGPEPSLVRNYRCLGNKLQDRLNLALPTTPSEAVAALIEMYGSTPIEELGHPKYQNVAWMELLQSARSAYEAMGNIFEPIDSPAPQGEARAAGPVAVELAVAEPMRQGTRV